MNAVNPAVAHFTVAYWCVLVAALLPIFCAALAKWGMFGRAADAGGYDNRQPRAWLARQRGWRARANAAQANSFEALPFFIGAVIIAHQLGANQAWLDLAAVFFIFFRLAYVLAYVADWALLRSTLWSVAFGLNVTILFLGYR